MTTPQQTSLALLPRFGHGGARPGAGRPRKKDAGVSHSARPRLSRHLPVHVTLRAVPGAPNLRKGAAWDAVRCALAAVVGVSGFRVVHFSVQSNHLHLLVEADGARALSRGMQALSIRIARGVNRARSRSGPLWRDRFHARVLRTPREVRNALCYVLQNARRHADVARGIVAPGWVDDRSSASWFDGWADAPRGAVERASPAGEPLVSSARSWLLARGWRRHRLLRVDEVPSAAWA